MTFRKEKAIMKTIVFSILNWNGLEDTILCIDSLLQSEYKNFHIYLLDNGSWKEDFAVLTKKYGSQKKITLYHSSTNLGFTWGNNHNLKLIQEKNFDYICLLNNDCIVDKDFLAKCIKDINSLHIEGIFWPIIRNSDWSLQSCWSHINLRLGTNPRLKTMNWKYQNVNCVSGSCFIISKKVFDEVGLLDDMFFAYREESDYCMRAKKLWYPIISIDSEWITHKEETANNKKKPYYTYLMFRNRILFLRKHANILQYSVSRIVFVGYSILLFPKVFGLNNWKYMWKWLQDGIQNKWWPMR